MTEATTTWWVDVRPTRGGYMATVTERAADGTTTKKRLGTRYPTYEVARAEARAYVIYERGGDLNRIR